MASILQWNCRGLLPNWEDFLLLCKDTSPDCVCLQEHQLGGRPAPTLRHFTSYFSPIPNPAIKWGGSAILVRKTIPSCHVPLRTTLQAVAATVHLHRRITLCSIYLPPLEDVQLAQLEEIISQLPTPFLFLGDFNARDPL